MSDKQKHRDFRVRFPADLFRELARARLTETHRMPNGKINR